jgi:EAL domain-containing protein (putative c-di-GMP-specific phosphodiesterase class I)
VRSDQNDPMIVGRLTPATRYRWRRRNYPNLETVRASTILARNLRLNVIAEGVETPKQHAQLRAPGCQFAQGYYFSQPVNVENPTRLIHEDRRC